MSHAHFAHSTRFAVVAACVAAASSPLRADDPPATVGTLRTVPVVSVSLAVGSTEKESKRVVYAPPPGWYVRSHRVVCAQKSGIVNYVVNTVPAGFNWLSDERTAAASKANASALVAIQQSWAGGRLRRRRTPAPPTARRTRPATKSSSSTCRPVGTGSSRAGRRWN